ncbi:MAG: hypothetical protein HC896_07730 [Bacteroidales bacterium]|nr:hypothetical protein [Bacteroidales bacterium]
METRIDISTSHFPIIILTIEGELNEYHIDRFAKDMDAMLSASQEKFIVISQQLGDTSMSPKVRVKLGQTLNYFSGKYVKRELGVFVVVNSSLQRIMMTCLTLVAKNKNLHVVSSVEEAMEKSASLLNKAA